MSKIEVFGYSTRGHVGQRPKTAVDQRNHIRTYKQCGGGVVVWWMGGMGRVWIKVGVGVTSDGNLKCVRRSGDIL